MPTKHVESLLIDLAVSLRSLAPAEGEVVGLEARVEGPNSVVMEVTRATSAGQSEGLVATPEIAALVLDLRLALAAEAPGRKPFQDLSMLLDAFGKLSFHVGYPR